MALDIFSNFDDHNKAMITLASPLLIWGPLFLVPALKYWSFSSQQNTFQVVWMSVVYNIVSRTLASKMGMAYSVLISWTMVIMWLNLTGLVPYVFSLTSHLALNLGLALPMWLSIVVMSSTFNLNSYLSHFQPMGSPALLNPFLCVIELVSNIVRPITLSVRLAANLSTGHIMLTLLGGAFSSSSIMILPMIVMLGLFYTMFEMAICMIQTYIFTLLPALYSDDHPTY